MPAAAISDAPAADVIRSTSGSTTTKPRSADQVARSPETSSCSIASM